MRTLLLLILFLSGPLQPERPVTIYLAGDSTMAEKRAEKRPETGWGERLAPYFDSTSVRIENHAQNGRSTRTFIEEGRWQAIVDSLEPGDYVFIQFGHNDESTNKPERYTPPMAYRQFLAWFVRDVRERGANPVLMTPIVRRRFDEQGAFYDTHGEYPDLVRAVADSLNVPLIDMHRKTERLLREAGPDASRKLFLQLAPGEHPNYPDGIEDNTHLNPVGADRVAGLAAEGIREALPGLSVFLAPKAP